MDETLTQLRSAWQVKHDELTGITKIAAPTPDQLAKGQKLCEEVEEIGRKIDEHNAAIKAAGDLRGRAEKSRAWASDPDRAATLKFPGKPGAQDTPEEVKNARVETVSTELDKKKLTGGFQSLGHFTWCTTKAGPRNDGEPSAVKALKEWDDLRLKAPTGMFEESDPDGGNLVPPGFSNNIYERALEQNQILSYLKTLPISGNTMSLPALKEDSRVNGSRHGGVQAYWTGEADQYQSSKPKTRRVELKLHKLTVLTPMTEELISDSPFAIENWVGGLVAKEINFKINDAVVNGTGSGMPYGILPAASKIVAAAESGQGANTIVFKNILKMYKRIITGQRGSLIWLYNQEAEDQLFSLYMPTGTASGTLIFRPNEAGNGFTLMGRPAIPIEQCSALGTEGDLIAFAPEGYAAIVKGGVQSFMSMHLRFDYDELVYKWRFRMDGQPFDQAPLTPFKGSSTVSSIVTLNSSRT